MQPGFVVPEQPGDGFILGVAPGHEALELELTPFHGHLMVKTEGVRDEQIPNGIRAGVPPATY